MDTIKKYKKYRKIGMKLNHKIMDKCLDRDTLNKSAKLLDIVKGGTFVFDSEDETSVLMDFALNDYRFVNKNVVERYQEKFGWKNEIEKEILDAKSASYTSLFKINSVSRTENILVLSDLLNKTDDIKLTDIAFSSNIGLEGCLLFTRLVQFKDFNMTSGVSFVFPPYIEKSIIEKYKTKRKKVKSGNDAIKRFVSFYKLYKRHGIETGYI